MKRWNLNALNNHYPLIRVSIKIYVVEQQASKTNKKS